ncbi:MAG TPA: hemolysin family protein [Paracoccaceae bacterium]|nr:hemolysin family protein [Paracoccaceae bacterium]
MSEPRDTLRSRLSSLFGGGDAPPRPETGDGEPRLEPAEMLDKMVEFETLRVEDVMVPRADIVAMDVETPLGEAARMFAEASHSRLPVYRETLDDPLGMVHIKDVIGMLAPDAGDGLPDDLFTRKALEGVTRAVLYVPPSMRAVDLLLRMQTRRIHMALVVDEYGGTDGLVTLEDLVEQIVGDIEDEHDEANAPKLRARGPKIWEADARASIEDFESLVGRDIATDEEDEDVDTLGGLVFTIAGRVPERGEVIRHSSGFEFEVVEADPRRVKRIVARDVGPAAGEPADK